MTFDTIVAEICERLNFTSSEATTRVGKRVNERYRRLTSSLGLSTSRFTQVSQAATIGNRTITFTGIEKVLAVIDKSEGIDIPLTQITMDEMHITPIKLEPPRKFAITNIHYNSVDVYVDCVPATTFTLYADGQVNLSDLSGSQVPDFPESFHDILIFGAMADEYRKMEKWEQAQISERDFETRLSDLRMWIAKTAYLEIHQGKFTGKSFRWTRDPQTYWDS